jgi:hypothetical protein
MDIDKNGDLDVTSPAEVFAAIHRARAYGVIHFKGPGGETVFFTFKRGLAQHASGEAGEGEEALKAVLKWREGEYHFIEDVMPDEGDFPANLPPEVATALGAGKTAELEKERQPEAPPLPILPAGEPAGVLSAENAEEIFVKLEKDNFTGCCAVGPAAKRWGLFLFVEGAASGGLIWDGVSFRRGDEAAPALAKVLGRLGGEVELFAVGEEVASAIAVGLSGGVAVTRMPSDVINVEEFLSWAKKAGVTGLISVIGGDKAANILIRHGAVLGAVVAPDTTVNAEADEALALFYAREATVEAFAATADIV